MTTAPADEATITEAHRPRPGHHFTTVQRILIAVVTALVLVIAGIGFAGSYAAVSHLAAAKGFGGFAKVFPIGLDSGIGAFLALDLLLTWLRIPFPLLRYGAWALTVATVAFNAAAAWPDPLGVGMHAVIPVLFVIAVEAARHAVGRIADITADKHAENPPLIRWLCDPVGTFRLWRRMRIWDIRSYEVAIAHQRQVRIYRARLRTEHGKDWKSKARAEQRLVLDLATRSGLSVAAAIAMPKEEEAALEEEERQRQISAAVEQQERVRLEREEQAAANRAALAHRLEEEEADRQRALADAETKARLADIERQEQQARDDDERRRRAEELQHARQIAEAEQAAQRAAQARHQAVEAAAREAERKALAEQTARREQERLAALANREPRTGEPGTANRRTGNANPEPRTSRTSRTGAAREPGTANLGDRAAVKQNQITAVVNLINELGYDAATLPVVQERTGMTKTTAYHRLTEARALWNQSEAS